MESGVESPQCAHKSVLVADDDGDLRRLIVQAFRRAGCDVVEVADGRALVDRFRSMSRARRAASVVVTDVEMPGMNGLDALERIRSKTPDAHVIVVTGFGDDAVRGRARQLGAAAVFSKPVDLELLRDTALLLAGQ